MYNALHIADAFNQLSERKHWRAKALCNRRVSPDDVVQFTSNNLVQLELNCTTGEWSITFKSFVSAWGDYIGSIRRSFFTVLNTLASAALPFDAPISLDHMAVRIDCKSDGRVVVSWFLDRALEAPIGLTLEQATAYENNFGGT